MPDVQLGIFVLVVRAHGGGLVGHVVPSVVDARPQRNRTACGGGLGVGSPFDVANRSPVRQLWPSDARDWHDPWLGFIDALSNSIVVTVLVVIGTILSSSLVGTAFAHSFRGRQPTFLLMLATMMLPAQVTMIPLFILFRSLGWVDTLLPLVVPAFFGSAFHIFMYRQFIAQLPEALFEAARLDGCGWLETWWRIIMPLTRPVAAITAVFTFIFTWNDFMLPLIYLHSEDQAALAVAADAFRTQLVA